MAPGSRWRRPCGNRRRRPRGRGAHRQDTARARVRSQGQGPVLRVGRFAVLPLPFDARCHKGAA
eukprot:7740218-Lingulodinium_polyedra.AAC.1